MKVNAKTITDDQIRELQRAIAGHVFPAAGMAHTELSDLWADTEEALGVDPNSYSSLAAARSAHRAARSRCSAAWNAHCGAES